MKGSTQTQASQSTSRPYGPSAPILQGILRQLRTGLNNTGLTRVEDRSLDRLSRNANDGNPYTRQIGALADDLFSGGPDRSGVVTDAYDTYKKSLDPFASGAYTDPSTNPGLRGMLDTIRGDISGRVNSMFAGAGRDLSGANLGALSRGIAEGTAPIIMGQYNTERDRQLGAINNLFGGGMTTAGALSGLDQTKFGNRMAGVDVSKAAMDAKNYGPLMNLQIAAQRRGIPMQNLGMIANMATPIAGLGGTTNSYTTGQTQTPLAQQLIGGGIGGLGLLGGLGGFGSTGWLYGGPGALLGAR